MATVSEAIERVLSTSETLAACFDIAPDGGYGLPYAGARDGADAGEQDAIHEWLCALRDLRWARAHEGHGEPRIDQTGTPGYVRRVCPCGADQVERPGDDA